MTHPDPTDLVAALEEYRKAVNYRDAAQASGDALEVCRATDRFIDATRKLDEALAAYRAQPRSDRVAGAEDMREALQAAKKVRDAFQVCISMGGLSEGVLKRHLEEPLWDLLRALPAEEKPEWRCAHGFTDFRKCPDCSF